MFSASKDVKVTAVVEGAEAASEKLAGINPHFCDALAGAVQV